MTSFKEFLHNQLKKSSLDERVKDFFLSPVQAIIYGAGDQARIVIDFCHFFHKPVACLLISPGGKRGMPYWHEIPLYIADEPLPDSIDKESDVILALHERNFSSILPILNDIGLTKIYGINNWLNINEELRDIIYDSYFAYHKFSFNTDTSGEYYISYRFQDQNNKYREYKCYYPQKDKIFRSNIIGELNDIMLPSIKNDLHYLCEGPYEWEGVTLQAGDVVLDLGANMGLFSGVAASKGCRVFAFEPTPLSISYLKKNLSFYDNVTILPYAVTDLNGKVKFSTNEDLSLDKSLGNNTIINRSGYKGSGWKTIEVDSISIDDFVNRQGLDRVDFIKADIEGAERQMLAGARETLARFAPKLALCTYHLPGDPEVMEQLILEANPKYKIIHKWSKLYAWCPN